MRLTIMQGKMITFPGVFSSELRAQSSGQERIGFKVHLREGILFQTPLLGGVGVGKLRIEIII